ncbi:glycoside hydrolase family 26 protein [Actinocorallia sp. A-T 12471]|uniref:glycoside hydrolase family 26 protein n=1 Tax=Actinocorallia sp. A-T 12471 TaxID=3089813 RepID=UPI0029CD7F5D|nr:glycosyl hydrolase [Actinocorallia sp. A-T 12471]MDX6743530.1 glycosyl hydrolase [Actinocorallia sp. A-T 12471]
MQFRYLVASALPLALVVGCSSTGGTVEPNASTKAGEHEVGLSGGTESADRAPKREYLGIYSEGKLKNKPAAQATYWKKKVGRAPNITKQFQAWYAPYPTAWAKQAAKAGAMPQIEWEPHGKGLIEQIAAGATDDYLIEYANAVKAAKVPISISFAHEMNGWWYDWGTKNTKPRTFVKAWRHIVDIFDKQGATNVKWLWTPNVTFPMPKVGLKQYYPGPKYVDWVGVIGYYRKKQKQATFNTIFQPTIKQIKKFSKKPILLAETGVQTGPGRDKKIADMLDKVAKRKDIIGLIWFDVDKRKTEGADYRLEVNKPALKTFRSYMTKYPFGRP